MNSFAKAFSFFSVGKQKIKQRKNVFTYMVHHFMTFGDKPGTEKNREREREREKVSEVGKRNTNATKLFPFGVN